ncbi:MAG: glycosyltransferase family 2 protein, partial [Anaerolineales bacterium]|nr:glycosyltransferase family 2 protein [Anaerolineales bacterium]
MPIFSENLDVTIPNRPLVSVVIPAYNEERRLPQTLARVHAYFANQSYASEILVVDDGSSDGTTRVVEAMTREYPDIRLIKNDHRGKGFTVRTGMLAARGHIVLFSDADLSTPIEEIEKLLPWFERGYDIVIGSREGAGAQRIKEPFYRHIMGRVFNRVVRLLTVRGIEDTQCGFKAFRDEVAHDVFSRMRLYGANAKKISGGMVTAFDVEVLFIGYKSGYRIKEVPVQWRYGTETKVNPLKDSYRNFRDVLMVRWNDVRGLYDTPPIAQPMD